MRKHWGNDYGVLFHLRTNERPVIVNENPSGKALFVEEIQSDWHNKGQATGYVGKDEISLDVLNEEIDRTYEMERDNDRISDYGINRVNMLSDLEASGVVKDAAPLAPYANNGYVGQSIKIALQDAVDNDLNYLAWTNSETQVRRWAKEEYRKAYENVYDKFAVNFTNKYLKQFGVEVKPALVKPTGILIDPSKGYSITDKAIELVKKMSS